MGASEMLDAETAGGLTVSKYCRDPVRLGLLLSVATIVKLKLPWMLGTPDSVPLD